MFLNEVMLGKEHHVDTNQSHLRAAPKGYDCVIAQGNTEPGKAVHFLYSKGGRLYRFVVHQVA